MNTKFYFFRHGDAYPDTLENIQFPLTPLNERGIRLAEKLRGRIKKIKSKNVIIISSPYQRSLDTMRIAAKGLKANPLILEELKEIGSDFWPNPDTVTLRNIEEPKSYQGCSLNVLRTFDKLWLKYKGKTVLIFTHGNWIRCLISSLMGSGWGGFSKLVISLASVTVIESDEYGEPLISTVSETAHLL